MIFPKFLINLKDGDTIVIDDEILGNVMLKRAAHNGESDDIIHFVSLDYNENLAEDGPFYFIKKEYGTVWKAYQVI